MAANGEMGVEREVKVLGGGKKKGGGMLGDNRNGALG